jgi:hypothetical protein
MSVVCLPACLPTERAASVRTLYVLIQRRAGLMTLLNCLQIKLGSLLSCNLQCFDSMVQKLISPQFFKKYLALHASLWYDKMYLFTTIGLSPGGSTHLHTNNTQNNTNNNRTTQITTNVEECGPCPVFASFTLAFALQPMKKHGKNPI